MQGDYVPLQYEGSMRRRKERELGEQIPQLPTRDLVAKVVDYSSKIDHLAKTSKNLKGTVAGMIREGALYTRLAVDALSTRMRGGTSEGEEALREELATLKAQVAALQKEKEGRDRGMMPPPDPPRNRGDTTLMVENAREDGRMEVDDASLPLDPLPPGKKKKKKKKKAPLSRRTQQVEEAGPSSQGTAEPPQPVAGVDSYATVLGRKARAAQNKAARGASGAAAPGPPAKGQAGGAPKRAPRRRVPRTSAVVITRIGGDYREALTTLRRKIKLDDLGIGDRIAIRSGATGARVIEVFGEGHAEKADLLAERIRQVLPDEEETRISRPRKIAEIRLRDLEDSLGVEEVRGWVADAARCSVSDVQCGALQPAAGGTYSLWARFPLTSAKEIVQQWRIRAGWVMARVALLEARPMRCHRCLERGHTRAMCPIEKDRSGRCYRCGEAGHTSRGCRSAPKCPLCTDKGRPAAHVLGAKPCAQRNVRGRPPTRGAQEKAPITGPPPG
ncbi:PREDICTED: uncharacterized protein LOC105556407 [Vollenhovia emeryi]|uniref:uncharacterized protein LOC105556407 n=1 Tax=Vollenhovia emeryi TaxID=411798 RepID=UPI0005F3FAE0|nr:PREDICTED: uncharacterized protein LOC105556407 [Vollenhovia emeryi]